MRALRKRTTIGLGTPRPEARDREATRSIEGSIICSASITFSSSGVNTIWSHSYFKGLFPYWLPAPANTVGVDATDFDDEEAVTSTIDPCSSRIVNTVVKDGTRHVYKITSETAAQLVSFKANHVRSNGTIDLQASYHREDPVKYSFVRPSGSVEEIVLPVERHGASFVFLGKSAVRGHLDQALVAKQVRAHLGDLKACYESFLKGSPAPAGQIKLGFTITATGKVSNPQVRENSLASPELARALNGLKAVEYQEIERLA